MARAWFFRVLLNSSSFSAILRSISCLTCPSCLDVLLSLLPTLTGRLLLLAQLDDHVLLVGDLVPQSWDLGVLGVLVLLAPRHSGLQILDLMTHATSPPQ